MTNDQQKLGELAKLPRTTFTKKQVIAELFNDIEKALQVRSYEEIAEMFTAGGLELSGDSLKLYLSKCRNERKRATKRKRTARQTVENSVRKDSNSISDKKATSTTTKRAPKTAAKKTPKATTRKK